MGNMGKWIIIGASLYLVVVGGAMYVSSTSTSSPTADTIAAYPSLGSAMLNLAVGGGLLLFHNQITSKLG
jgi:hypothetical protein